MEPLYTDYDLMMALLRVFGRADRSLHIGNVLGAPYREGELASELQAKQSLTIETRAQARACARHLEQARLIVPTYSDLTSPEEWMVITQAGRDALQRGAIDDLDSALWKLSPSFVEMRHGAWRAANSSLPDAQRQAAHSARELLSQVLKVVSPNEEIKSQSWYIPRKPGQVTRRDRHRLAINKRERGRSDSDLEIAEKGSDLMEAVYIKLSGAAHTRDALNRQDIIDQLHTAEMVLRKLLI